MEVKILSPNKNLFEGKTDSLTLPGENGQLQILNNHATLFTLLDKGKIIVEGNKEFFISSGIAEVVENKIIILVKEL